MRKLAIATVMCLALAACGGGSSGNEVSPAPDTDDSGTTVGSASTTTQTPDATTNEPEPSEPQPSDTTVQNDTPTSAADADSVDTTVASTAAPETTPVETDQPETGSQADQLAAEAALLVLADFPSDWAEVLGDNDANPADQAYADCVGGSGVKLFDLGGVEAKTEEFVAPSGNGVSETITVVTDEAVATDFMNRFGAPGVDVCLTGVMQSLLEDLADAQGVAAGAVSINRLALAPVGDELVGYRVSLSIKTSSSELELFVDLVAVRSGRAIAGVDFDSQVTPFPDEELNTYLGIVADRLATI